MFHSRHLASTLIAACVLAMTPVVVLGQDAGQSPQLEAARLIGVLNSDAPVFDKAKACQRLAVIGDKDAAEALASLLADKRLAAYARSALEAIPHPAADDALRAAAGRLDGELLIGVLGSIGKRRDTQAIDRLTSLLDNPDRAVAAAAARALGYIGEVKTAEVLQKALAEIGEDSRPAVALACLICAGKLQQQDHRDLAVTLYDAVRNAKVPKHLALAATRSAIIARGKDGLALLAEQLNSDDEARFRFALQAARDLGAEACGPLIAQFDKQPATRQALLILALSHIGHKTALPVILDAAQRGAKDVRIQAIHALGRFGDPSAVATLLGAAVEPDEDVAGAARAALALLQSDEINAAIARMLGGDNRKTLQVAIDLAGQRSIASAAPALLKLAASPDAAIRLAAVKSLGSTIALEDLPKLIALAIAPRNADRQPAYSQALKTACARLPREGCTEKLTAAMAGSPTESKVALLEQIAAVGGTKALAAVVSAARSDDDAMQDAATRLLGAWITADAAPELFDLAKTLTNGKYKIRALRGYLRIARQLNMTPQQRLEVCRGALQIADRNEERALALQTLGRIGSPQALALAVSRLDDPELKEPACNAVVAIAEKILVTSPAEAEKCLQRAATVTTNSKLADRAKMLLARARRLLQQQREETEFVPLFDGKTTNGWNGKPAVFRIEDGAIVGGSLEKPTGGNDFFCTDKAYGDFELRLQFKLLGDGANGGVNLRSRRLSDLGVASGYQADLGEPYWGSLYDEARRERTLARADLPDPYKLVRKNDWNDYRIRCEGRRIRLWVNGVQTVDYVERDPNIALEGLIGLQIHAGRPSEAWYRNLRIRLLDESDLDR